MFQLQEIKREKQTTPVQPSHPNLRPAAFSAVDVS